MAPELLKLGWLAIGIAVALGPVLLSALLLNLRDRRKARLLAAVLDLTSSPDLRGRLAIRVHSGILWPRSVVALHILLPSRNEIWDVVTRLSRCLPPRVRVEIDGLVDRQVPATLTVKTGDLLSRATRPFAASA